MHPSAHVSRWRNSIKYTGRIEINRLFFLKCIDSTVLFTLVISIFARHLPIPGHFAQDKMSLGLIFRKTPYPAINPKQPKLSQAGKTVLVTEGNGGIGLAITRNFITAGARRVIIVGRSREKVELAASRLMAEGQAIESTTIVDGCICDTSDIDATTALWDHLEGEGIVVDVVVMNAASFGDATSLLEAGRDRVWQSYITNVRSHLGFAERLYK